jgi:hypothetical protein
VEYLCANGHLLPQIMGYTLRQLWMFHTLARARHSNEAYDQLLMMRVATQADKKSFLKFIKDHYDG